MTLDRYIFKYGEKYRKVFTNGLKWLDNFELKHSIKLDRDSFVEELTRPSTYEKYR